jgi:hypothetical protein
MHYSRYLKMCFDYLNILIFNIFNTLSTIKFKQCHTVPFLTFYHDCMQTDDGHKRDKHVVTIFNK